MADPQKTALGERDIEQVQQFLLSFCCFFWVLMISVAK